MRRSNLITSHPAIIDEVHVPGEDSLCDEDKGEAVTLLWQVPTGSNDPIVTYTIYIRERCVVNGEVYNGGQRAVFKWDWGGVREGDVCEARKKPIA